MVGAGFGEGRVPPYSQRSEMAVLGCILLKEQTLPLVRTIIDAEDFYMEAHVRIFKAMCELDDDGSVIDHVTLGMRLKQNDDLDKIGGPMGLDKLTSVVATTANVEHYAAIVQEQSAIRKVIYEAQMVAAVGYQDQSAAEVSEKLDDLMNAVAGLAKGRMPDSLTAMGEGVVERYNKVASGYRGIELPWPTITNMTAGLWPRTVTIFVARPGVGKCVRGDTLILDPMDGVYRPISEVVRDRRSVLTREEDGSVSPVVPNAFLYTGQKECVRIKLASGRELSGTPEHPVMTVDGWRRLDEISDGDHVEVVGYTPEPRFPEEPSESEVVLLAALLAEGGYTSDRVGFSNQDEEILRVVRGACSKFGLELRKTKGMADCDWNLRWKKSLGRGRDLGPNPARVLLDKYGCGHKKAKEKIVPDRVFSFSSSRLALFLGVLWGCDGYVCGNDVGITLASREMVFQIQRLLLRFSVLSSVSYKKVTLKGKSFDSWRLRVYSNTVDQFRCFINVVSFHKRDALSSMSPSVNPNRDNIPITDSLGRSLRLIIDGLSRDERVACYDRISRVLGMTTRFSVSKIYRRNTVSRRVFKAFIDAFDLWDEFGHLIRNHWDNVISVQPDGVHDVYDLTVHGSHSFIANDLVVHNTFVAVLAARHAWSIGKRVLIVSPEMSKEEIAERFFVIEAGVSYANVIRGELSSFEMPKLVASVDRLRGEDGLWIMDSSDDLSPRGMEAAIRASNPDLVAVDSIYDIKVKGERRDRVLTALDWMKKSAREIGYAAVGFAQQNRVAELSEKKGGGARLGTIALADEIGQDSHAVFALEQTKDMKADKVMNIKPLKLRRGVSFRDSVKTHWDFDKMKFDEIAEDEEGFSDEDDTF